MRTHTNCNDVHATRSGLPAYERFRQAGGGLGDQVDRWGAVVGLAGSPTAALLGMTFLAAGYFAGAPGPARSLTTVGNMLLFSVIPLLLAGAHFLDRLESRLDDRAARRKQVLPFPNVGARAAVRRAAPTRIRLVRGLGIVVAACAIAGAAPACRVPNSSTLEVGMLDVIFVLATILFFLGALGYTAACDKL